MVITLLVLLIDASLKSRSPGPTQQLAAGTWVDRVLPVIESSTAEGAEVRDLWSRGLAMSSSSIAAAVSGVASGAEADYRTVSSLQPPTQLEGAAGLLEATLLARSQAAAALEQVFRATLGSAANSGGAGGAAGAGGVTSTTTRRAAGGTTSSTTSTTLAPVGAPPSSQVATVAQAGSDVQVGDQAYRLFAKTFPASVGVPMPSSVWATTLAPYQTQTAEVFLASLQSSVVTSPVHQLQILSVSISPAPVGRQGPALVVPDAPTIAVTVVVADTGNQAEAGLTVNAAVTNSGSGSSATQSLSGGSTVTVSTVHDSLNLLAGQAYTIAGMGPLAAPEGVPNNLVVTVQPQAGSLTPPVSTTVQFSMPAPPPPTTTTSTTTRSTTTRSTTTRGHG